MRSTLRCKKLRLLSVLLTLSATSGCAHVSTDPVPLNNYCSIAQPIYYNSKVDTPDTVQQIEKHNSKWACVCESDCPKPEDR